MTVLEGPCTHAQKQLHCSIICSVSFFLEIKFALAEQRDVLFSLVLTGMVYFTVLVNFLHFMPVRLLLSYIHTSKNGQERFRSLMSTSGPQPRCCALCLCSLPIRPLDVGNSGCMETNYWEHFQQHF